MDFPLKIRLSDEKEGVWVWKCSENTLFYYEINREIRLKGYGSNYKADFQVIEKGDLIMGKNEKSYFFIVFLIF